MERGIEIRVFFDEGAQRAALVGGENRWIGRACGAYGCGGVSIGGEVRGLGGEVIFCVGKMVACVGEIIACVGAVVPVVRRWVGPAGRTNAPPPLVGRKRLCVNAFRGVGARKRLCFNLFFGLGGRKCLCINVFRGVGRGNFADTGFFPVLVGRIVARANVFLGVGGRK